MSRLGLQKKAVFFVLHSFDVMEGAEKGGKSDWDRQQRGEGGVHNHQIVCAVDENGGNEKEESSCRVF